MHQGHQSELPLHMEIRWSLPTRCSKCEQDSPCNSPVLAALNNLTTEANAKGHRVAFLGDFNAAPPGGRWGYSKWSVTAKEDQTMTDWITKTALTEVF